MNWSSLLNYGDLNYYYNVIYQISLFSHINSRNLAFKSEKQSLWNSSVLGKVYGYNPGGVDID